MISLYTNFREVAEKYKQKKALHQKENNKWKSYNYGEVLNLVDNFSQGLLFLQIKEGDRILIMSENSAEWLISDLAINQIGAISVPVHTIANIDNIEYLITDSGAKIIIVSDKIFLDKKDIFKKFNLKVIIVGEYNEEFQKNIYLFKNILEINKTKEHFKFKNISENVASLVYTSGTTGVPKGVMLTNANFISNVDAARKEFSITAKDKFLSFLPLSHVLERTLGSYIPILSGAEIYYSEGIKQLKDNLAEVKPTILICVPKILERFYEGVRDNAEKGSNLKKKIFYFALKNKDNFFADVLVFRKIRKLFGGNLRFCVSGGASINSRILKFFYNAKIKITEGYGLTETSPIISANKLNNLRPGSVGELLEDVQVKISVDKEILVKGANVMKGYWQQAKKTKETFDKDGWFKTGDQGYLDNENFLFITGRKKDLIVTSNGKNIAPEKIENILNLSPYILQSLVVGHKRSNLTVLIVVDKNNIKDINDVKSIIQKEIDMVNKNLEHHEYIKAFELIDHPFSQELGELTPTLKIRRFIVEDKYAKVIERMYVKN